MSENLMPSESELFVEDFVTLLEQSPSDLPDLEPLQERLEKAQDESSELAIIIKKWCREMGLNLDRKELAAYRINMGKNLPNRDEIPEGEKSCVVYNKALLEQKLKEAKEKRENSLSE